MKMERPNPWFAMSLFSFALITGLFIASTAFKEGFMPELLLERLGLYAIQFAVSAYLLWNYVGGCFRAKLTWGSGKLGYQKGSPNWIFWPQTGFSGCYEVATTKYIYATFLGLMISGEGPGVAIPLPVGWKCMGEWFSPMVEACITNEGQMNYKVAKELESGRRFAPQPELAQRVREYLDAEGPFGGRVIRS